MALNSQRFVRAGELAGIEAEILENAVAVAEHTLGVRSPGPPISTSAALSLAMEMIPIDSLHPKTTCRFAFNRETLHPMISAR